MAQWWRGSVTYQVYPRSFQDTTGTGIGDLAGVTRRLDYIASLGVDAIWLSPIFTSPMADMGYDVSNYTDVDPMFGTLAEFDTLLRRAHDLGLKVVIDKVLSHCSSDHPLFRESRTSRTNPKADWFVWADCLPDGNPPNNWLSVFGGRAWEWDTRRRQYYMHNFLPSQPDFNFHNPEVQDWALETMRFWLDRGVDGFRLDTVNYYFHDASLRSNPPIQREDLEPAINPYEMQDHVYSKTRPENIAFLERIRALVDEYRDCTLVGEVGESHRGVSVMSDYTRGTNRLHMAYSFEFLGPQFSAEHFRSRIEKFFRSAPDGWPAWAFSNHDVVRHVSRWADHGTPDDIARLAAALILSFEGSIYLYQGEELGQTETDLEFHELTDPPGIRFWPDYKGRDGCRTPMVWDGSAHGGFTDGTPWLPVKAPQLMRNAAAQVGVEGSTLETYRQLLAFRRATPLLRAGKTRFLDTQEPILAFQREADGAAITAIFNLSPRPLSVTLRAIPALTGPTFRATLTGETLELGPNGYAWAVADADGSGIA